MARYCVQCGNKVEKRGRHCQQCGADLARGAKAYIPTAPPYVSPPRIASRPRYKIAGIGCGAVILVCVVLATIGALVDDGDKGPSRTPAVVAADVDSDEPPTAEATATGSTLDRTPTQAARTETPRPPDPTLAPSPTVARLALVAQPDDDTGLPDGVPRSAEPAEMRAVIDGDKFQVQLASGALADIRLSGIDAPETHVDRDTANDECFAVESRERIDELIPAGTTVYLEASGKDKDGKDRLLRYVWVPRDGEKAYLLNTKLVREGFSVFDAHHDNPRYVDNLEAADDDARENGAGLWGACGGPHEVGPKPTATATVEPTVTPVPLVVLAYSPTVSQGGTASIEIQADPFAECVIGVSLPSGAGSTSDGLGPKQADANGYAGWWWTVGTRTTPGTGRITVSCDGRRGGATFEVVG